MMMSAEAWLFLGTAATGVATIVVGVITARYARASRREVNHLRGWSQLSSALERDAKNLRQEVVRVNSRLDRISRRLEEAEDRELQLVRWAREVVVIMRRNGVSFPPPPPGVEKDMEYENDRRNIRNSSAEQDRN